MFLRSKILLKLLIEYTQTTYCVIHFKLRYQYIILLLKINSYTCYNIVFLLLVFEDSRFVLCAIRTEVRVT